MDTQSTTIVKSRGETEDIALTPEMEEMFKVGAHYGYSRTRRHPTIGDYIFGHKNKVDVFDLEKTIPFFDNAKKFAEELGSRNALVLFVGGKHEAAEGVKSAADRVEMPFVAGRWLGGTITNFGVIRSRVDRMLELKDAKAKGDLDKYTKKERLKIDEEIVYLDKLFYGLIRLTRVPDALIVVDPKQESTAINEAKRKNIPVIALCNTDCDISEVDYPILGNDASRNSVSYFINKIADAYSAGKKKGPISASNSGSTVRSE